jgi:SGNH hydrolase-like domain, acetyltransferase AlgX
MASMHRYRETAALVALNVACWGATTWSARMRPGAAGLTDWWVALALAASYASAWWAIAIWRDAPRRDSAVRALASTFVGCAVLLLLELPAAFGLLDYAQLLSIATGEWRGPATSFVTDSDLLYRRPAHQSWSGRPRSDMAVAWNLPIRAPRQQSFTTDARGFRNRRDLDHADIALVGDSFVEGAYVADDETCAADLERRTGLSVENLGQSGYGTLQELKVVEKVALPLRPRMLLWFFFEGNDLYDDQSYENGLAYLRTHGTFAAASRWRPEWRHFREASFTVTGFRLLRRIADPLLPNAPPSFGWFDRSNAHTQLFFYADAALHWSDFERQRFEKTKAAFLRGRALCAAQGIHMVIVFIPTKFRVYGDLCRFPPESPCLSWHVWRLADELTDFCRRQRIAFFDLTDAMQRAAASGDVLYAPEDSHWSAEGHRFVAGLLAEEWKRIRQAPKAESLARGD